MPLETARSPAIREARWKTTLPGPANLFRIAVVVINLDGDIVRGVVVPKVRVALYPHPLMNRCCARERHSVLWSILYDVIQVLEVPPNGVWPPLVIRTRRTVIVPDCPINRA